MSSLLVSMASTREPSNPESGFMALYLSQLKAAGIDVNVEMMIDFANSGGGGTLGGKIEGIRKVCTIAGNFDHIIFSDAFDVQFFGSKADVIAKMPNEGVLMAAEKNCYPEPELAAQIDMPTVWAFVNGGLLCGRPSEFLKWCDAIEAHPAYDPNALDQAWFNRRLAESSPIVKVDSRCEIFLCLFGDDSELCFCGGLPYNKVTGTSACFIHANGGSNRAEIWERVC